MISDKSINDPSLALNSSLNVKLESWRNPFEDTIDVTDPDDIDALLDSIEADSEEEAYDLVMTGHSDEYTEEVVELLNEVSSEHQYTEKIEEDE